MQNLIPHHIIAIGASAGGMEEINSFFDHTPLDGVAYVIIQHLSSDFKSRMVELLGKHSKLAVSEAEDGSEIKSNQVYLIPNDKFMTMSGGRLRLSDKAEVKGPHLTINAFFNSLAADCGNKAIGISRHIAHIIQAWRAYIQRRCFGHEIRCGAAHIIGAGSTGIGVSFPHVQAHILIALQRDDRIRYLNHMRIRFIFFA